MRDPGATRRAPKKAGEWAPRAGCVAGHLRWLGGEAEERTAARSGRFGLAELAAWLALRTQAMLSRHVIGPGGWSGTAAGTPGGLGASSA